MAKIEIKGLYKNYGDKEVLHNIDLAVNEGELVTLIGRSGSGKSTLIRCLNLLEAPTSGQITFNGDHIDYEINRHGDLTRRSETNLSNYRLKVGMVFQHFNLFPNRTVMENLTDGPRRIMHKDLGETVKKAEHLLELVDLTEHKDKYPSQISGGQQQRVSIARALMMDPEVMLFDEPTSALDPEMVNDVLKVMIRLKHAGMTMIVVTHEMAFTEQASDRVLFLEHGEINFEGSPQKLRETSEDSRVKHFINTLNHRVEV